MLLSRFKKETLIYPKHPKCGLKCFTRGYRKVIILICCEMLCGMTTIRRAIAQQSTAYQDTVRYTLTDVWDKLLLNNKKLTIAELMAQKNRAQLKDAKSERLPDVELGGEYDRLSSLPEYTNGIFHAPQYYPVLNKSYNVGSSAYFNIYNGNSLNLKISDRTAQYQIAEEEKNLTRSELKVLAAAYYLGLERSIIFKKLTDEDIMDLEKQLIKIKVLQKNGVVLKSDVLRADLKLSREKFSLVQIQNDIDIINQRLAILIGADEKIPIDPVQSFTPDTIYVSSYGNYLEDAMVNSFQIHIEEKKNDLKTIGVSMSKSAFLPIIGLVSNYAFNYPQGTFYPYSNSLYGFGSVGVKVSWSVSAFFKNRNKVKAAEIDLKSQLVSFEDVRDSTRTQVTEAYLRFKEALTGIEVARKNVTQATESHRVLTNSYFNQTALITDLLDANTEKLQAAFDLESSKMNAQLKYFQLQQIIGNL